jgi:hypothetical protein
MNQVFMKGRKQLKKKAFSVTKEEKTLSSGSGFVVALQSSGGSFLAEIIYLFHGMKII